MRLNPPEAGFLGLPVEPDLDQLQADVVVLGVPHGWPYPRPGPTAGCAAAPAAVRAASQRLARFRGNWDFDLGAPLLPDDDGPIVVDAGDVPGDAADGAGNSRRTTTAVRAVLDRGALPVCIGGDDSVPIPILRAFESHGPVYVLQLDAHLDFRDTVDGVREGYSSPMRRAAEMPHVARIVQVGLRGIGSARPSDVADARAAGNVLVTARELRERGAEWALARLPDDASVFLALDCDALDPAVLPAVSAPSPGGLSYSDAWDLVAGVRSRLAGAAVTELVPDLDPSGASRLAVVRLVLGCILAGTATGAS